MALNLVRNSRVFFTTNVNATTGVISNGSHTATTTKEIQVLEGLSFTQNTNNEVVTISEAGVAPVRGQRSFNTSLAPVDFSFSTYIRPDLISSAVDCEENVLWNALAGVESVNTEYSATGISDASYAFSTNTLTLTGTSIAVSGLVVGTELLVQGITGANITQQKIVNGPGRVTAIAGDGTSITIRMSNVPGTADIVDTDLATTNIKLYKSAWGKAAAQSILGFHNSNKNQLQKFGLLVVIDSATYAIDNAALTQVTIDFGLDGIATAQWSGQATAMRELAANITTATTAGTFDSSSTIQGNYTQKNVNGNFITNKLSTVALKTVKALGTTNAGTSYTLAITGGSITINNNINYITPAILGIVNNPITYYTGTRSVTGSLNAYLNTGGGTGNLLKDMLAAASTVTEPMFALDLAIGGSANAVKVELQMPSVSIGVPTLNTEQVVSTTINFTASPSQQDGTAEYDLENTNELTVRYFSD